MTTPHINDVRSELMETLRALRDRANPMDIDRARAVAQVAGVLVDTAKVENDYLKLTGQDRSDFMEQPSTGLPAAALAGGVTAHNPFPTSARHRLAG